MKYPASPSDRFSHDSFSPRPRLSPSGSPHDSWRVSPSGSKVYLLSNHVLLFPYSCSSHLPARHSISRLSVATAASTSILHQVFAAAPTQLPICLRSLHKLRSEINLLFHLQPISTCRVQPVATTLIFILTTAAKCTFKAHSPTMLLPAQTCSLAPITSCIAI